MSEAAILIPPDSPVVDVSGFSFDAVLSERYQASVQATRYPREDGTIAADHAIDNPDVISVDAVLTDTPFGTDVAQAGRAQAKFDALWALLRAREPVEFDSTFFIGQVIIVGLSTQQDERTGYTIPVSMQLEEVLVAQTEFVVVPPQHVGGGKRAGATPPTDEGKKKGAQVESRKASVLHGLFF